MKFLRTALLGAAGLVALSLSAHAARLNVAKIRAAACSGTKIRAAACTRSRPNVAKIRAAACTGTKIRAAACTRSRRRKRRSSQSARPLHWHELEARGNSPRAFSCLPLSARLRTGVLDCRAMSRNGRHATERAGRRHDAIGRVGVRQHDVDHRSTAGDAVVVGRFTSALIWVPFTTYAPNGCRGLT